jgi:hypothetical protein
MRFYNDTQSDQMISVSILSLKINTNEKIYAKNFSKLFNLLII